MKLDDRSKEFMFKNRDALHRSLAEMGADGEILAKKGVPVRDSHLQNSINHVEVSFLNFAISAGGHGDSTNRKGKKVNTADYARFQEFGGDGKRTVRNYSTAGTGKGFLKKAGDTVSKNLINYVRKNVNQIKM
jgi:hypothetical protein